MKTIIDLQKVVGYPAEGIFKQSVESTTLESMFADYAEKIDSILYTQYGNRRLYPSLEFANDLDVEKLEMIKTYILSEMLATQYKWEHLIATTKAEYNPTENYNMVEEEKRTDVENETNNINTTINNGERTSTSTNLNAVAPYNTDAMHNQSQVTENTTDNAVSDNSTTEDKYTTNNVYEKKLTRSGNIGVTTTQQMLESERKLANYSVVKEIAKSVAGVIASNVYYNI